MRIGANYRHVDFSGALAALALLAMALRALTPAGYMLAPAEIGGRFVAVTLCTDHGPVTTIVDRAPHLPADGGGSTSDKKSNAPCVFAAAGVPLAPEFAPVPVVARLVSIETAPRAAAPHGVAGMAAPPPWATGPPLSA